MSLLCPTEPNLIHPLSTAVAVVHSDSIVKFRSLASRMFASLEKQNLLRELRRKVGLVRRKFITSNVSNISGRIGRSYEIFDYEQYII